MALGGVVSFSNTRDNSSKRSSLTIDKAEKGGEGPYSWQQVEEASGARRNTEVKNSGPVVDKEKWWPDNRGRECYRSNCWWERSFLQEPEAPLWWKPSSWRFLAAPVPSYSIQLFSSFLFSRAPSSFLSLHPFCLISLASAADGVFWCFCFVRSARYVVTKDTSSGSCLINSTTFCRRSWFMHGNA